MVILSWYLDVSDWSDNCSLNQFLVPDCSINNGLFLFLPKKQEGYVLRKLFWVEVKKHRVSGTHVLWPGRCQVLPYSQFGEEGSVYHVDNWNFSVSRRHAVNRDGEFWQNSYRKEFKSSLKVLSSFLNNYLKLFIVYRCFKILYEWIINQNCMHKLLLTF